MRKKEQWPFDFLPKFPNLIPRGWNWFASPRRNASNDFMTWIEKLLTADASM